MFILTEAIGLRLQTNLMEKRSMGAGARAHDCAGLQISL